MKKFIAMTLMGTMICAMSVMPAMAKEVGAPVAVYLESDSDIGEPAATVQAINQDKLIDEYTANAITGIWAMDKVVPVAQGGKIVLDGKTSNVTFVLDKPELSRVYSAKDFAKSLNGNLLNVVCIDTHVGFGTANVNFYTPGIVAGQNVKVYQYTDNGWVALNVTEVRDDHVVADLTSCGEFAFIDVPAAE